MSRLSIIIAVIAIAYLGCICPVYSITIHDPRPINEGDFIHDFFGSEASEIVTQEERDRAQSLIRSNHNVPRYTFFSSNFTVTRAPAYFCSPRDYNETSGSGSSHQTIDLQTCDWSHYIESLLLMSLFAFIIAIIIFPFLFCGLSLGRCCCCGKYRPTPTLCCGDPDDFEATTNGYTDCCVLILLILSIACCLVMVSGAGVGLWGSQVMTDNVIEMSKFVNKTGNTLADIVADVVQIFRDLNGMSNISDVINETTLQKADDLTVDIRNISSFIEKYAKLIDTPRSIFMYITLLLPLCLMLLVIISRFICWWMTWGMTTCGFILTFLSLVTFGLLYPLSSGLADICVFLDDSLADEETNVLDSLFKCSEDSVLGEVGEIGESIYEVAANVSCTFYDSMSDVRFPCDLNDEGIINISDEEQMCPLITYKNNSEKCSPETLDRLSEDSRIFDRKIGCYCKEGGSHDIYVLQENTCGTLNSLFENDTSKCPKQKGGEPCMPLYCHNKFDVGIPFKQCNQTCKDTYMRGNSSFILDYTLVASSVSRLYNNRIKPYLNCDSIAGVTNHAKNFLCIHMINAVTPMYIGEILGALGTFVGTFVALLSTKRFRRKYRRKYAIMKEGESAIEL